MDDFPLPVDYGLPRHKWLHSPLWRALPLLIGLAAVVAFIVLVVAPSAGASGGCGGG